MVIDSKNPTMRALNHLDRLEAESIYVIREVAMTADRPVMLYSIGKDSTVLLHLAQKAFSPSSLPFPLLHIDTGWKFQDMYRFRDTYIKTLDLDLIVYKNPQGLSQNINPMTHDSSHYTDVMKTQALKQALDQYNFDAAFGGARRDEERSRAKERVLSFRNAKHQWDPKHQRPELWNVYNTMKKKGESFRVFPLSNWTELDVWLYILRENIPIVPLYLAKKRPVVIRNSQFIMVDDARFLLEKDEKIEEKKVRFRTLGCYPLTAAMASNADTIEDMILEMLTIMTSERHGRLIDRDNFASMEKKKKEGYF